MLYFDRMFKANSTGSRGSFSSNDAGPVDEFYARNDIKIIDNVVSAVKRMFHYITHFNENRRLDTIDLEVVSNDESSEKGEKPVAEKTIRKTRTISKIFFGEKHKKVEVVDLKKLIDQIVVFAKNKDDDSFRIKLRELNGEIFKLIDSNKILDILEVVAYYNEKISAVDSLDLPHLKVESFYGTDPDVAVNKFISSLESYGDNIENPIQRIESLIKIKTLIVLDSSLLLEDTADIADLMLSEKIAVLILNKLNEDRGFDLDEIVFLNSLIDSIRNDFDAVLVYSVMGNFSIPYYKDLGHQVKERFEYFLEKMVADDLMSCSLANYHQVMLKYKNAFENDPECILFLKDLFTDLIFEKYQNIVFENLFRGNLSYENTLGLFDGLNSILIGFDKLELIEREKFEKSLCNFMDQHKFNQIILDKIFARCQSQGDFTMCLESCINEFATLKLFDLGIDSVNRLFDENSLFTTEIKSSFSEYILLKFEKSVNKCFGSDSFEFNGFIELIESLNIELDKYIALGLLTYEQAIEIFSRIKNDVLTTGEANPRFLNAIFRHCVNSGGFQNNLNLCIEKLFDVQILSIQEEAEAIIDDVNFIYDNIKNKMMAAELNDRLKAAEDEYNSSVLAFTKASEAELQELKESVSTNNKMLFDFETVQSMYESTTALLGVKKSIDKYEAELLSIEKKMEMYVDNLSKFEAFITKLKKQIHDEFIKEQSIKSKGPMATIDSIQDRIDEGTKSTRILINSTKFDLVKLVNDRRKTLSMIEGKESELLNLRENLEDHYTSLLTLTREEADVLLDIDTDNKEISFSERMADIIKDTRDLITSDQKNIERTLTNRAFDLQEMKESYLEKVEGIKASLTDPDCLDSFKYEVDPLSFPQSTTDESSSTETWSVDSEDDLSSEE